MDFFFSDMGGVDCYNAYKSIRIQVLVYFIQQTFENLQSAIITYMEALLISIMLK